MSRVFVSHSSRDSVAALALKTWLEGAEPGLVGEIFVDLDPDTGIPSGVRWKEALKKANDRCEAVICLLSKHWDASHECRAEYRTAEDRGKPIFPVRLEPTAGRDITSEWQRCDLFGDGPRTVINVDGGPESVEFVTAGLVRLQKGLRANGIAPDTFAWPPEGEPDRAPYRGWQPLEAVDAAVYFGRDAEINRALTAIRELRTSGDQKLFVILGPSGVGKSSFLRAGLLPRLQRDDRHFLSMDIVRPQRHPLTGGHGLAHSVHALRTRLSLTEPGLGAIKSGVRDPDRVRCWLVEAQHAAVERFVEAPQAMPPTIVLPFDQAEELFGAEADEEARDFMTVFADLLRDGVPPVPVVVIATIRADRYEPLQTAPQLAGLATRPFDDLKPMPPDRFREVICSPAARAQRAGSRLQWAPELVERLLRDCASGADTLPLLSLTLARLYQDYGDGVVGLADYKAMGGMRRVVETEIDRALSADPETRRGELQRLRGAFIPWLATINPTNNQPLRRVARWFDLPADSHPLIDALVARRLLVKDERDGEVVVEVALESLLRQWDTLAGWLHEEAADLKATDVLEQAARTWDDNGRQDDWLLAGARLADAETLAAKPGFRDRLNAAREYLLASRQLEDRRTEADLRAAQRRTRTLRAVLVLVVIVAVAVVGFGWALKARIDSRERLRDATAVRLQSQGLLTMAGLQPGGGSGDVVAMQALLAGNAISSNHREDENWLLAALYQRRNLLKILDVPEAVSSVAFGPGDRIASGVFDDGNPEQNLRQAGIRMWDAAGKPIGKLISTNSDVLSVALSPDGRLIASGDTDMTVWLWDAATGKPIGTPMHHLDSVSSVAFSPDGTRIASGGGDTISLWDAATGKPVMPALRGHEYGVTSVAFPTAPASPPAAPITPSGCGMPPTASRSGNCAATPKP